MIQEAIARVVENQDLTAEVAREAMLEMMDGRASQNQIASFMTAMRMKGETERELLGFVLAMRGKSVGFACPPGAVDLCGTGGDGAGTFNISTAASFVVAAAGIPVAKHGNKSVSSKCGSADVLSMLRIPVDLDPVQVGRCLSSTGLGFMFAPVFHSSMRNVAGPRRELGLRTFFNILGPMTNPAGVRHQLIGLYDAALAPKMAGVLHSLGTSHAMFVNGGGMDEISTIDKTRVVELVDEHTLEYELDPSAFDIRAAEHKDLRGGDAAENARIMVSILKGEDSARSDIVALNAGAAIYVSGRARSIHEGLDIAKSTLRNGKAYDKLKEFAGVAIEAERERQMGSDVPGLRQRQLVPEVLVSRAAELSADLVAQVSNIDGGKSSLMTLDPDLLSNPNVLSVIVLRRMLKLLKGELPAIKPMDRSRAKLSESILTGNLSLVAEYKPCSPSAKPLVFPPDPVVAAEAYSRPGVSGVSVLVEPEFFSGSPELFSFFRTNLKQPMLFKDFVVSKMQVELASRLGADAVLLIAKALESRAMDSLASACTSRGMEPMIEIHDENDLTKLVASECYDSVNLVGINSRDLRTLGTDLSNIHALRQRVPAGKAVIAESGVRTAADLARLKGFDAVLVGTALMGANDLGRAVDDMVVASRNVLP
jgi:anthranilate phosphoribosyltransferase